MPDFSTISDNTLPDIVLQPSTGVPPEEVGEIVSEVLPPETGEEVEPEFDPPILEQEVLSDEMSDPFSLTSGDPLAATEEDKVFPATLGQLEAAREMYAKAMGRTNLRPPSIQEIMSSVEQDATTADVNMFMQEVNKYDAERRKAAIISAISNPKVGVELRLKLVQEIHESARQYDLNLVEREALRNVNTEVNSEVYPESVEDKEAADEYIESIPPDMEVMPETSISEDDVRKEYVSLLNAAYEDADSSFWGLEGAKDFAGMMIPFRFDIPVQKIYSKLGLAEREDFDTAGRLLLGNALSRMREHILTLPAKERMQALGDVLGVLKNNIGLLRSNDMVSSHILSQIFYEDLYGKPFLAEQEAALATKLEAAKAKLNKNGVQEDTPQWMQEQGYTSEYSYLKAQKPGSFMGAMDNAATILDAFGIGGLAKYTIGLGIKSLPKPLARMNKVAPDVAASELTDALSDPAVRAKYGDLTPEQIVETILPSASAAIREGSVNGMGELVRRSLDARDALLGLAGHSNLSMAERTAAFKELSADFEAAAKAPRSVVRVNDSVVTDVGDGVEITAVFGRTTHKPYSTLGQARKAKLGAVEGLFGKDTPVEIVGRNRKTGQLEKVDEAFPDSGKGEFYLQAKEKRSYDSARNVWDAATFGDKDVRTTMFGSFWNTFLPAGSVFSPEVYAKLAIVPQMRASFNKVAFGLMSDIGRLSNKQQKSLSFVLKEGEKAQPSTGVGKTFTPTELRDMGLDEAGVTAYYNYRAVTDIMHEVVNAQTRTLYLREGLMDVHTKTGRVGFARPVRRQDVTDGADVYDPVTNTFHSLSARQLDELYERGEQVAKLKSPMLGSKAEEATHVWIKPKDGMKVLPPPRQVVNKVEGYYPHMWEGNYVLFGLTKKGNRVALGIAKSESDAKRVAQGLERTRAARQASGKNTKFASYRYDFDRSLTDVGQRGAMMDEVYLNMGGPVYGHRNGGELRNLSKADGDAMVDPILSLVKGMEIVGQSVTKGELMQNMRMRLYNYAKSKGILRDPKKLPTSPDDLINLASESAAYNRATTYLKQIDTMAYIPDMADQQVSAFFRRAAQVFDKMAPTRALGKKLSEAAGKRMDPTAKAMGLFFRQTIASSPMAQAALQASQSLMAAGLSPTAFGKALRQSVGVAELVAMRALDLHGATFMGGKLGLTKPQFEKHAENVAKLIGLKKGELITLVDHLVSSGFIDSVGHHTAMRSSMRSAGEARMMASASGANKGAIQRGAGSFVRGLDNATFGNLSRFGFEAGENMNRVVTTLALYNKDKAKKLANLSDKTYLDGLIARATELTGSMIPELSFSYQRGWLKAAFQFVNFQHKMLFLTMPEFLGGSRQFTLAEKAGMVLAQFLLFGRRAAPHTDALYRLIEDEILEAENRPGAEDNAMITAWRSEPARALINGVVADWSVNEIIQQLKEDAPEFAISSKFAPGGGVNEFMAERLFAIFSGAPTETFFGLAGERISVMAQWAKRAYAISLAQATDMDTVDFKARAAEMVETGSALMFSSYNRYLAVRAAEARDGYVSSGGAITEGFDEELEGALFKHFGIMTKDRESLYDAMNKYREEHIIKGGARDVALQELSKEYFNALITRSLELDHETPTDEVYATMQDRWIQDQALVFSVLPRDDAARVSELVRERVQKLIMNPTTSAERRFVERMIAPLQNNGFGSDTIKVGSYLENAEFVKNNRALAEIVRSNLDYAMQQSNEE